MPSLRGSSVNHCRLASQSASFSSCPVFWYLTEEPQLKRVEKGSLSDEVCLDMRPHFVVVVGCLDDATVLLNDFRRRSYNNLV